MGNTPQIDFGSPPPTAAPDIDFSKPARAASTPEASKQKGFMESLGESLPGYNKDDAFSAIKDLGSGMYHIFSHPIDSANLAYHGVVDPMQLTTQDAVARMKKQGVMNKINGAIEYAESGVPFLGPAMAKAGQQNEEGNWAGGAGTVAGAALPFVTPGAVKGVAGAASDLVSKVTPGISIEKALGSKIPDAVADTPRPGGQVHPALNNTPREVLQHAADEGIQLTPGQATENGLAQHLQKAGRTAAIGGRELEAALGENRAKFGQSVNDFMEDVDPKRAGLSQESAGEAIQQSAKAAKDVSHTNASNGYKNIDYLMDKPVDPAPISAAWNQIKANLPMGAEEGILAQTPRSMRGAVEDMLSGKPDGFKPTFNQAIQLRKFFRDLGDTQGLPSLQQASYKGISQAFDNAMESTASSPGVNAAAEWRAANAGWKDYATKYGDPKSPFYKILNQRDPTKTVAMLQNAPATDIAAIKAEGMDAALEPLRRTVVDDMAKSRFRIGHDGLGGYSDSYLKSLFSPEQVKELYLKGDLANRLNYDPNPSGTGGNETAVSQLTLGNQSKMSLAAKLSMPRDAMSFLENTKASKPTIKMTPFAGETATPYKVSNEMGIKAATAPDGVKIYIKPEMTPSEITQKLEEQRQMQGSLKLRLSGQ